MVLSSKILVMNFTSFWLGYCEGDLGGRGGGGEGGGRESDVILNFPSSG